MKQIYKRVILLALCALPTVAWAQIDDIYEDPVANEKIDATLDIKDATVRSEYHSHARARAEYLARRKERNTLSISGGIQGSSTSLNDAWIETSGGDNTIAILGSFDLDHKFTYEDFSLTSKILARFGYNRIMVDGTDDDGNANSTPIWFKYQDEIFLSTAPSIKLSNIWSYGASVTFRSQFANGYVSRTQQESIHLKSKFLAPGYLDISGGMTYSLPSEKWPFKFTLSPLAMSATYVSSEAVRLNYLNEFGEHIGSEVYSEPYGVSPYVSSRYEGGSAIQVDFQRYLDKQQMVEYITSVYSFYGWITQVGSKNSYRKYDEYTAALDIWNDDQSTLKPTLSVHPTLRWDNTLKINAMKYLATTINFRMYYSRTQNIGLQCQTLVNVGVVYTFKNK